MISDTPPAVRKVLFAGYRRMSAIEKFDRVRELNQLLEALAFSDIRIKNPDAPDRGHLLVAAARRLSAKLFNLVLDVAYTEQTTMSSDPVSVVGRLA